MTFCLAQNTLPIDKQQYIQKQRKTCCNTDIEKSTRKAKKQFVFGSVRHR